MAIAIVAGATNSYTSDAASLTAACQYGASLGAGHLLVAVLAWNANSADPATVAGATEGAFTKAFSYYDAGNQMGIGVWYKYDSAGGSQDTITATWVANASYRRMIVAEFSGVLSASDPLDIPQIYAQAIADTTTDAGTTGITGNTPAAAGDLWIGAMMEGNTNATTVTVGTGYSLIARTAASYHLNAEYLVQGAAADIAATWTWDITSAAERCVVTFKEGAAAGGLSIPVAMRHYAEQSQ